MNRTRTDTPDCSPWNTGAGAEPFFGRKSELEALTHAVEAPDGRTILVVGQQVMGKTTLLKKFLQDIEAHPSLRCRTAWFSVTEGDSSELTMSLIMSAVDYELQEYANPLARIFHKKEWRNSLSVVFMGE